MRPPRYHFPDEVRSTTREMAARMVHDGTVARTPQQLDAWIAQAPEFREPLERGGYGTHFTSGDLFPLLEVFVAKAGASAPAAAAPARRSWNPWVVGLVLLLAVAVLVVIGVTATRS
jgi:hypothetical protein